MPEGPGLCLSSALATGLVVPSDWVLRTYGWSDRVCYLTIAVITGPRLPTGGMVRIRLLRAAVMIRVLKSPGPHLSHNTRRLYANTINSGYLPRNPSVSQGS